MLQSDDTSDADGRLSVVRRELSIRWCVRKPGVEWFLVLVDLLHSTTLWRVHVVAQNRHSMIYRVPAISRLVRKRGGRNGNTGFFDGGVAGKSLLVGDVRVAAGMARWMGNSEYPPVTPSYAVTLA